MARKKVTKPELTGEKFASNRWRTAAVTGNPNSIEDPTNPVSPTFMVGTAVVALGLAIMFMLSKMEPSPDQGNAEIMATQSGGLYVAYADEDDEDGDETLRLHPAMNLASARLIVGSAEKPTVVKDDVLNLFPRGQTMGIPAAPDSLDYHNPEEVTSSWAVCDWYDSRANLSLTNANSLQSTVIAGEDALEGGNTLGDGEAILVRPADDRESLYLLYDSYKAPLDSDDSAAHAALGIGQDDIRNAVEVTPELINSIQPRPKVTTPRLDSHSLPSKAVSAYNVGDVITTSSAGGAKVYHAVLRDGIQRVPETVAELLVASGGSQVNPPASFDSIPQGHEIDLSAYPSEVPDIVRPDSTCLVWQKEPDTSKASVKIIYSDSLPITKEAAENIVTSPTKKGRATQFVSTPGKGWYVRVTGNEPDSDEESQVAYVADNGVRYDVMPDDEGDYSPTVAALGLSGQPMTVPDGIARLLHRGPDLDRRAALITHVNVPLVAVDDVEEAEVEVSEPSPTTSTPAPTTTEPPADEDEGADEDEEDEEAGEVADEIVRDEDGDDGDDGGDAIPELIEPDF